MNLLGVIISYLSIFLIIFIAKLLSGKKLISDSLARKVIHIGVSFWWIIASLMIDSLGWALIGPVSFIIINFFIARFDLVPGMNSADGNNYGTVYFPISLVLLLLAVYLLDFNMTAAGCGVLVLGWGDGMASIIGEKWHRGPIKIFKNEKSLSGSFSMFIFSYAVVIIYMSAAGYEPVWFAAIGISLAAAVIELVTPFGLDNITVPVVVTILMDKLVF